LAGVDVERIGSTRLRVRLEPAARARWFALPGPFRVVIDVEPARSEPDEAAGPLVVLDPGHGGFDRGARHEGLVEKDLVLDLALRVERHLGRIAPSIRVVLTRRQDVQLSLEERVAHANALEADAFVSIHLNADWEPVRRGGVTTFVLDVSTDEAALRLAARENGTRTSEVGSLERMLAALQQREQAEGSRRLAEHVHRRTLEAGRRLLPSLPDRGVRAAMFYVLVGARMPAVLLEASFLNQPDEHRALATESYRDALARGIALGIVEYFAATRPALRAPP
ncbi:MAG: N-acetylmuramoyl-L-alanine amidase, partial [Myxococcota bacterium]|nr:N-acetylmuramoyl-L-alanine amidase [Myxococcota bacterium]